MYHERYRERIETLIKSKLKADQVKEKIPKKPVAKHDGSDEGYGEILEVN